MRLEGREPLRRWLEGRAPQWRQLDRLLAQRRDLRGETLEPLRELVQGLRALAHDLSLARTAMPEGRLARQLEVLYLRAHELVYRPPQSVPHQLVELYTRQVPQVWRELRPAVWAVVGWLIATMAAGWLLVYGHAELATLFASEAMIEGVERGELWTDDLLNVLPSSVLSLAILTNNIIVSLSAFVLGAFYGLGTIYIIGVNGLMLGGVFAFTARHGMAGRLFEFVVAHGIVELSVICLAGAAGVALGEALARPGGRSRGDAFHAAVSQASRLLAVVVPFLVGAGYIEGYVSPNPVYGLPLRTAIGCLYGVLLWTVLSGGLWRALGRLAESANHTRRR